MERHIASLPIPKNLKIRLEKCGIESINELKNTKPVDLIKSWNFTKDEVNDLIQFTQMQPAKMSIFKPQTASELLNEYNLYTGCISTSSSEIDRILNGGIQFGKVTELCGCAGIGKTQFCIQLCVNVQFAVENAQAIYIDTEGSFMTNRVFEIANESLKQQQQQNNSTITNVNQIMSNILYFRCTDSVQLMSTINNLKYFLNEHKNVKLIILDSLAYLFRFTDSKDTNTITQRTTILNTLQEAVSLLILEFKLAFVITNQMTTKFQQQTTTTSTTSNLVPALGEIWAHFPNLRLLLFWKNNKRFASVCKSSSIPENHCVYQIKESGIRDLLGTSVSNEQIDENDEAMAQKKHRYS